MAGDATAFEEIFAQYQGMVYNLALRYVGDATRAEDLAQEALLKISSNLHSFRGRSSLKTWIYQVATNCYRSKLRRKRPQIRSLDQEDRLVEAVDQGLSPESRTYGSELGRELSSALAQLPLVFREAVVLRDVEGLSYEEIAGISGCRLGTVRSRIARGRDQLRKILQQRKTKP